MKVDTVYKVGDIVAFEHWTSGEVIKGAIYYICPRTRCVDIDSYGRNSFGYSTFRTDIDDIRHLTKLEKALK